METLKKIYVAGHCGMVGSAIVRALRCQRKWEVITRTHAELDLTNQAAVNGFFAEEKPAHVYLAAARVGGVYANEMYPAQFIYENLMIEANVVHAASLHGVEKLLFLGSSSIYSRHSLGALFEGVSQNEALQIANEPYAIAKIAGITLCDSYSRQYGRDFRSVLSPNLYGPGDKYSLSNCHVIPAMIRKFHLAKLAYVGDLNGILLDEARYGEIPSDVEQMIGFDSKNRRISPKSSVNLWGTGTQYREFLYVDDLASACIFVMGLENTAYRSNTRSTLGHINVGFGREITVLEAAQAVAKVVGYNGQITFDAFRPDGTPRRLIESAPLEKLGWKAQVSLEEGLQHTYADYLSKEFV